MCTVEFIRHGKFSVLLFYDYVATTATAMSISKSCSVFRDLKKDNLSNFVAAHDGAPACSIDVARNGKVSIHLSS